MSLIWNSGILKGDRGAAPVWITALVGLTLAAAVVLGGPGASRGSEAALVLAPWHPPQGAEFTAARQSYGKMPLAFEANQGQTDPQVKFLARGAGYTLFLTSKEAVLSLQDREAAPEGQVQRVSVLCMQVLQANPNAPVSGLDQLPGVANYFRGREPQHWQAGLHRYARVQYKGVYPGVDLVYYGKQGHLEFDFEVAAGASVRQIGLGFTANPALQVEQSTGDLVVRAGADELRFHKPLAYQDGTQPGTRRLVEARYVLRPGNRVGFDVPLYDASRRLVIDPALSYSTYLGGTGNDYAASIAVDSAGNAYITGHTSSVDFPVAAAIQPSCSGGCVYADAFVTKLDATGTGLIYSTYLGGSGNDYGNGIALDQSGNAYVVGQTYSDDFPITAGAYQTTCGGGSCSKGEAFIVELNSSGSALTYSTYLGGSAVNQGNAIALDSSRNAYVTGYTQSTDFPVTRGVVYPKCKCSTFPDLFVTELNSTGSALVYSTYLGGSSTDLGYAIALDPSNNAYVTGYTASSDFPTTPGAYQTRKHALTAGFVTKLNPTATSLVYSTYLGGSTTATTPCETCGTSIAVDSTGSAFVAGLTAESNFPVTPGAFQTVFASTSRDHDAFITKFNTTGTALVFSTYLGGPGDDGITGLKLDNTGNIWVKGNTKSPSFPVTPGAYQLTNAGDFDAFVSELDAAGAHLLYSTYLGGSGTDFGGATGMLAVGNQSPPNVYVIAYSDSTNFPVTSGAFQTFNAGQNDGTVSLFVPSPNLGLSSSSLNFGSQTVGTTSAPQLVTLTNTGNSALLLRSITLTGSNPGDFAQSNNCTNLPARSTCTVSVTFTPSTAGTRTASVSITDNAPDSPEAFSVSGTGVQKAD
jgi:hypothetical protein